MRPAFHWNIKQLFVYVVASYESTKNSNNQVVIWDKIIEAVSPEDMVIDLENVFVKYAWHQDGNGPRTVHWLLAFTEVPNTESRLANYLALERYLP